MENKKTGIFGIDLICAVGDELRAQRGGTAYSARDKVECELAAYRKAEDEIKALEKDPMVRLAMHEAELRQRQRERLQELRRLRSRGELLASEGRRLLANTGRRLQEEVQQAGKMVCLLSVATA